MRLAEITRNKQNGSLRHRTALISRNYMRKYVRRRRAAAFQNTGGSRMRPVAKYMARSGAIHRNHTKAASRNAPMNPPINAWSCVRRSRNHCNLLGIYSPQCSENYEECISALEQRSISSWVCFPRLGDPKDHAHVPVLQCKRCFQAAAF